jgi:hypothetical protein
MRSAEGTRSAVEVHTVSLADARQVVGVFGIMELDTEYASPTPLREVLTPRHHQVRGPRGGAPPRTARPLSTALDVSDGSSVDGGGSGLAALSTNVRRESKRGER